MEIKIAIKKIDKDNTGLNGDTVEVIERPNGGISIVLADGKFENQSSKSISSMVTNRVLDSISKGIRDGASIRSAAKEIFIEYQGKVQANLAVISADLQTNTIILSRNSPLPAYIIREEIVDCLSDDITPIGLHAEVEPNIIELPIQPEMSVVVFSDGLFKAGSQTKKVMDFCSTIEIFIEEQEPTEKEIADFLLNRAIRLDNGKPVDDMSIIVLQVSSRPSDSIRRMQISMPLS